VRRSPGTRELTERKSREVRASRQVVRREEDLDTHRVESEYRWPKLIRRQSNCADCLQHGLRALLRTHTFVAWLQRREEMNVCQLHSHSHAGVFRVALGVPEWSPLRRGRLFPHGCGLVFVPDGHGGQRTNSQRG
jgi:hypothetical protein